MATHYALNLEPVDHDLGEQTLERYISLFEEDKTAKTTMNDITVRLVKLLDLKIDKQRLDSTHIFSDMASFGRTHPIRTLRTMVIKAPAIRRRSLRPAILKTKYSLSPLS